MVTITKANEALNEFCRTAGVDPKSAPSSWSIADLQALLCELIVRSVTQKYPPEPAGSGDYVNNSNPEASPEELPSGAELGRADGAGGKSSEFFKHDLPIRVIIESPFGRRLDGTSCTRAEIERNTRYVRRAVADSLRRGEAPFASHALYPLVLDDATPAERRQGMESGFAWGEVAGRIAVYEDHGVTDGVREGLARHEANGIEVVYRSIGAEPELKPRASEGRAIVVGSVWRDRGLLARTQQVSALDRLGRPITEDITHPEAPNPYRWSDAEAFRKSHEWVSDAPTASTTPDLFRLLTPEEFAKVEPVSEPAIREALEQGARDAEAVRIASTTPDEIELAFAASGPVPIPDLIRGIGPAYWFRKGAEWGLRKRQSESMPLSPPAEDHRGSDEVTPDDVDRAQHYAPLLLPQSVDPDVIRAAEDVVLEAGNYVVVEAGKRGDYPKDYGFDLRFAIQARPHAGSFAWLVPQSTLARELDLCPRESWVTAVRRVEAKPEQYCAGCGKPFTSPDHDPRCSSCVESGTGPEPGNAEHAKEYGKPSQHVCKAGGGNDCRYCVTCGRDMPIIRSGELEPGRRYRIVEIASYDKSPTHAIGSVEECDGVSTDGAHGIAVKQLSDARGSYWFAHISGLGGTYVTAVDLVEGEAAKPESTPTQCGNCGNPGKSQVPGGPRRLYSYYDGLYCDDCIGAKKQSHEQPSRIIRSGRWRRWCRARRSTMSALSAVATTRRLKNYAPR